MSAFEPIRNKVAESDLVTIDMSDWLNIKLVEVDLSAQLEQGLILREKEYRDWIASNDWQSFSGSYVYLTCTTGAIIPNWAYMLVASALHGIAKGIVVGTAAEAKEKVLEDAMAALNLEALEGARVIVKGCGEIGPKAYTKLTLLLKSHVQTLMFGEPCSTVPVFKKARK